jgi:hypothetical protein
MGSYAMTTELTWPDGRRAAISLTYDDALPEHFGTVAPLLERHGMRGTFYTDIRQPFMMHHDAWRAVAAAGHELGNHTLFHPCRFSADKPLDWLDPSYNLCRYSPRRWRDEMRVANFVLQLTDGRTQRTFGNTCCDITIGEGESETSLDSLIAEQFVAARGKYNQRIITRDNLDLMQLGHWGADGCTFATLRERTEQTLDAGGWIIMMTHGVGAENHRLHIDADEHARWIEWLGTQRDLLWVAPVVEIALHLRTP